MKKNKAGIRMLLAFITISIQLSAQEIKTFKGEFANGSGQYSYYEDENGERIKHGYFYYEQKGYQGIGTYGQNTASIVTGSFKNGKHDGEWIEKHFEYKAGWTGALSHWDPNEKKYVVDGFVINNNKSIDQESIMKCHYTNGVLNGAYELKTYKAGKEKSVLAQSVKANFTNGAMTGKYSYSNEIYKVTGGFDDNGFLDGVWSYQGAFSSTKFVFTHGFTKSTSERNKGDGELIRRYDNLKPNYLDSLRIWGFNVDSIYDNEEEDNARRKNIHETSMYAPLKEDELPTYYDPLNKTEFLKVNGNQSFRGSLITRSFTPLPIYTSRSYDSVIVTSKLRGVWTANIDSVTQIVFRIDTLIQSDPNRFEITGSINYKGREFRIWHRKETETLFNKFITFNSGDFEIDRNIENEVEIRLDVFEEFASAYIRFGKVEKEAILFKE